MARLLVLFHSFYGNTYRLAEALAEGARQTASTVALKQVPETVPEAALAASGALEAKVHFAHVPTATIEELPRYDGIAFGTGTRFGNMTSSMRSFLEQTGKLWNEGALIGKVATVFAGSGTGGGRETTIISAWCTLAHHGMIIVPAGYADPGMKNVEEVHGGTPYGTTFVQRASAPRPSDLERSMAKTQGRCWAEAASRMARG
jgi:NAD(P)H dehydrogenase (quinone)